MDLTQTDETAATGATALADNAPIMIPGIAADGSLYQIEKMEAHRKPTLHLAISVFLFSSDGDLLIQRRADSKYHCPGEWANTCCTHPHWGEEAEASAHRRLLEELGIPALELEQRRVIEYAADVGQGLWEHERVHMYRGTLTDRSLDYPLNPDEVSHIRWISPDDLRREMTDAPETFTPWFKIYAKRFPDYDF
jgi:isopentenyl-diphosphate delta-isomerase